MSCSPSLGESISSPEKTMTFLESDAQSGSSTAVIVPDLPLVHTTQVLPLDRRGMLIGDEDAAKQTEQVLANLGEILAASNASLDRVCKLNLYVATPEAVALVRQAIARRFAKVARPAVTLVVGKLPNAGALVAMDAVAPVATETGNQPARQPPTAKLQNGIRSAAILPAGPKIYVSGMADTNNLPEATRKTLEKLVAAIGHLGLDKKDIVQLKAFLQPIAEVESVRKEIVSFFAGDAPPVVFVEWISPKPNPPIEIELIAPAQGDFSHETNSVTFLTPPGTTDSKVFRRVARVNHGKLIYLSGLYGQGADGGSQVRDIFHSLDRVLHETGSDFFHLVKATYYVSDDEASNKLNDIRPQFYDPLRAPTASKARVPGVGVAGKTVTLDMIAVTK
jgi:enamine deaminase RidA (YjgF/YER057c/UK114 family)